MTKTKVFQSTSEGLKPAKPEEPKGEFFDYWKDQPGVAFPEALAALVGIEAIQQGTDAPHECGHVDEALLKLGRPKSLRWDPKHLCLVIDDGLLKFGVVSSSLRIPVLGFRWSEVEKLYQGLKARMANH